MRTPDEQHFGLDQVARLVSQFECNCGMQMAGTDVAFLQAVDTPNASQVVYASGGYDVWNRNDAGDEMNIQATDLTAEDAAAVIIIEYLSAKAARVKVHKPHMTIPEIMHILVNGYQHTSERSPTLKVKLENIISKNDAPQTPET